MKKTEVIWIDDETSDIQNVVNKMFRKLWEEEIRSNIYIVTDKEERNKDLTKDIDKLNEIIVQEFVNYLISKSWIDNEKGDRAYALINSEDDVKSHGFTPKSDVTTNKSNIFRQASTLIQNDSTSKLSNVFDKEKCFQKDKIIMIDMCLSQNDFWILSQNEKTLVMSMHLYNYFKHSGYPTYMYTTFAYPTDLINTWRTVYQENFNDECVKFFNRSGEDADNIKDDDLLKYILKDVETKNDKKNSRKAND